MIGAAALFHYTIDPNFAANPLTISASRRSHRLPATW